jgi:hypothetical protein
MAAALRDAHGIRRGDVVGILCRNGAGIVRAVFAAARLGARVTLLNPEMAKPQLADLLDPPPHPPRHRRSRHGPASRRLRAPRRRPPRRRARLLPPPAPRQRRRAGRPDRGHHRPAQGGGAQALAARLRAPVPPPRRRAGARPLPRGLCRRAALPRLRHRRLSRRADARPHRPPDAALRRRRRRAPDRRGEDRSGGGRPLDAAPHAGPAGRARLDPLRDLGRRRAPALARRRDARSGSATSCSTSTAPARAASPSSPRPPTSPKRRTRSAARSGACG